MAKKILDHTGRPISVGRQRGYDAAKTTRHNEKHFLTADGRDADSLIAESLSTLRNRVRYEVRNNCYAAGIVATKANDIIGTGPRLQFSAGSGRFNEQIETRFSEWSEQCEVGGLLSWADLLQLVGSRQQDESGEAIVILTVDNQSRTSGPRFRLQVVEPDRLDTPFRLGGISGISSDGKVNQGIEYDSHGRPMKYYILKKHPGSDYGSMGLSVADYDIVPADIVLHLYKMDRPGQTRGVPWLTPAMDLFPLLRRYTLATTRSAETAANLAGVIEADAADLDDDDTTDIEELESFEIESNMLTTMPRGWKMNQYDPKQPAATYSEFKKAIISEIARCLSIPYNVAAADASKHNYASGRLDWQGYFRTIKVHQTWIERRFCIPVFRAWLSEALVIPGYLPSPPGRLAINETTVKWYWPGQEHVDPQKEATAQKTRIENRTTTLAYEYARQGKDWEVELHQIAREKELIEKLGIATPVPIVEDPKNGKENDDEEETNDTTGEKGNAGARSGRPRLRAIG